MAAAVFGPIPRRSVSVLVRMRRSSSPSARPSTTAAAVRKAWTRCVGSRARSSRKAILRSAPAGDDGADRASYLRAFLVRFSACFCALAARFCAFSRLFSVASAAFLAARRAR